MAKCIKNRRSKEVRRVSDDEAAALVEKGGWVYIGKSEFKREQQQDQPAAK